MISIRWVTWWPSPYWTSRFNVLSKVKNVNLEVVYLCEKSEMYNWQMENKTWNYSYRFLDSKLHSSGYYNYKEKFVLRNPFPLVNGNFDVLITQYADSRCIGAMFLCKLLNRPYYLFSANTKFEERKNLFPIELLKRILFSNAAGILATGPLQQDYSMKYVKNADRISIVGNPSVPLLNKGLTVDRKEILRTKFGWGSEVVLLFVGRLSDDKGLFDLLEAVRQLKAEYVINPRLVMVGSGPNENSLRDYASQFGISLDLLGFLEPNKLAKVYEAADVFILPSKSEAWGLVVNEAMEFGLPIILSNRVGCYPLLLQEGKNGFLFPAGNIDKLKLFLKLLCSEPNLRSKMSNISLSIIQGHTIGNWVANVMKAIAK